AAKNEYKIRLNASVDACRYLLPQRLPFQDVSHKIQTEIIHCFAEEVIESVIQEVDYGEFCLLVDESADVSEKEKMTVLFCFVDKHGIVKESFIGLVHMKETFSLSLKCDVDSLFAKHGLSMNKLRGQGYNGASNMKGEFNGLRALILRKNNYAYYYVKSDETNSIKRRQANGLLKYFYTFDFVFYLQLMLLLLGLTNNLSKALQRKYQDILNVMSLVKSPKQQLYKFKNNGWKSLINKIFSFCENYKTELLVKCFCTVLDMQIQEFNDHFDEVNTELLGCIEFLSLIDSFHEFDQIKKELLEKVTNEVVMKRFQNMEPHKITL
ncbi:hypothetical protein EUTSA_v10024100mg, partial [Eutrema salsugineum]